MCCHVPGLFTRTIPAIVIPRKTSSDTKRRAPVSGGLFVMTRDSTDNATTRLIDRRVTSRQGPCRAERFVRPSSLSQSLCRSRTERLRLRVKQLPSCRSLPETRVFASHVFHPCASSLDRDRDSAG